MDKLVRFCGSKDTEFVELRNTAQGEGVQGVKPSGKHSPQFARLQPA